MAPARVAMAESQNNMTISATKPGLSIIRSGPGRTPYINIPAIRIAVGPLPGIPNTREGINAPPEVALLALSAAITPSISPWPKYSLRLERRRAMS